MDVVFKFFACIVGNAVGSYLMLFMDNLNKILGSVENDKIN